jgi:hypothetical protein
MDVKARAERLWARFVVVGIVLQLLGGAVVIASVTNTDRAGQLDPSTGGVVLGAIVGLTGIWMLVIGLVMLGVALAMGAEIGNRSQVAVPRPLGPVQRDPAQLANDQAPFVPHASDSPVIADVRRALLLGKSQRSVRRIVANAAGQKRLADGDQAMIDGLIAESVRRPLGPLPPQF